MKYWEIIVDNLSKAGCRWGGISAIDSNGRTIWIAEFDVTNGTASVPLCGSSQSSFAAPKRIRLKSHMRFSGSAAKIVLDHVIRRPNALSAELKGSVGGLNLR
jgi:hypothetical protein